MKGRAVIVVEYKHREGYEPTAEQWERKINDAQIHRPTIYDVKVTEVRDD